MTWTWQPIGSGGGGSLSFENFAFVDDTGTEITEIEEQTPMAVEFDAINDSDDAAGAKVATIEYDNGQIVDTPIGRRPGVAARESIDYEFADGIESQQTYTITMNGSSIGDLTVLPLSDFIETWDDYNTGDVLPGDWTTAISTAYHNGTDDSYAVSSPHSYHIQETTGALPANDDWLAHSLDPAAYQTFTFSYRETSNGHGGTMRLMSGGQEICRAGTNNPQWEVKDANGWSQEQTGLDYNTWYQVTFTLDYSAETFDVTFDEINGTASHTTTDRPFITSASEADQVSLSSDPQATTDDRATDIWLDDIEVKQ